MHAALGHHREHMAGDLVLSLMGTCVYACICSTFRLDVNYCTLHMGHANMYLHMHGLHLQQRTIVIRKSWVTMGMDVPFVAAALLCSHDA